MLIDPSGRGPTMRQLYLAGIALILVATGILTFLMLRFIGTFDEYVPAKAQLKSVADGLPQYADVKYRGVFVGTVENVSVVADGALQQVDIHFKPEHIDGIPANVTARVVPSTVFGVTAVELLEPKTPSAHHLTSDVVIQQDSTAPTLALQSVMNTLRDILTKVDPERAGVVLTSLSSAFDPSVRVPGSTVERLDNILTSLDGAIPDLGTELGRFRDATGALNQSAPELMDVLGKAATTGRTITAKREQLTGVLTGGLSMVGTINNLFATNPDMGKILTDEYGRVLGALDSDPEAIPMSVRNLVLALQKANTGFSWGPSRQMAFGIDVTFTPFIPYTREDCPRYGSLAAPSCTSAPTEPFWGQLPESWWPADPGPAPAPNPSIAGISGLPFLPGLRPSSSPAPAPGTPLVGPDAVAAILGRKPSAAEYLLFSGPIAGGFVTQGAPALPAPAAEGGN